MVSLQHPIQVVSRLTGLSPHVIRVWEKRYGAVVPSRTGTNRRLYSDDEIERLRLLARATEGGHKIGIIAKLGLEDLRRVVAMTAKGEAAAAAAQHDPDPNSDSDPDSVDGASDALAWKRRWRDRLEERRPRENPLFRPAEGSPEQADARLVVQALDATRGFRSESLQAVLEQGSVRMGTNGVLHRLICPLAREIGELWQRGEVTAAHEHFASAVIREFLMRHGRPYASDEAAPRVIVTTPAGQLHELGAVVVAAAAANLGWRPVYLGPSLPPAEIAGAAIQNQALAVLLSIVYPADDRWLGRDLLQLRKLLPRSVEMIVGGRAASAYHAVLKEIGAIIPDGIEELCELLAEIRQGDSLEGAS